MDRNVSTTQPGSNVPPPSITILALEQIVASSTHIQAQRRKHYDQTALAELATNIKQVSVIEPIIVRPLAKPQGKAAFEIVAGERRWLASQKAGLTTVPAIARTLDDQQVLEIQLVENLHREGLHELDEAEGYEALMKQHHYGIDELIAKLGKSRAYIYARLKLLALGKKARTAFYDGKLSASTALLLARIPGEKLQDDALKLVSDGRGGEPLSFREAQREIQHRYMLRLTDASFDKNDVSLVPDAGPCGTCPKRTGNQPELFGDVKSADVCTDPVCFGAKRQAWAVRIEAAAKAEGRAVLRGEAAKRIAPYGTQNLQGGYVAVDECCYSDSKGRSYRKLLGKALGPTTLLEDTRNGGFVEIIKLTDYADTLKDKGVSRPSISGRSADERARIKAAKVETTWRERVFAATRTKTPTTLAGADLRLTAHALWNATPHEGRMRLVRLCDWAGKDKPTDVAHRAGKRIETMNETELRRLILDCALIGEVHASSWSNHKPENLLATAKRLKIDAEKIRKSLKDELAAKTKGTKKAVSTGHFG